MGISTFLSLTKSNERWVEEVSIINSFLKGLLSDPARDKQFAIQMQQELAIKRYDEIYWLIALTLYNAIAEYHIKMKVEERSAPKLLQPEDYLDTNYSAYRYVLSRTNSNVIYDDGAVSRIEIIKILTAYFKKCGYSQFKLTCKEDSDNYYVTLFILKGYRLGGVLSPNVGVIRFLGVRGDLFNEDAMYNSYGTHGKYFILYYQGGWSVITPRTTFWVYRFGYWYKTSIMFDDYNRPCLTCFTEPLDNFIGCVARL